MNATRHPTLHRLAGHVAQLFRSASRRVDTRRDPAVDVQAASAWQLQPPVQWPGVAADAKAISATTESATTESPATRARRLGIDGLEIENYALWAERER